MKLLLRLLIGLLSMSLMAIVILLVAIPYLTHGAALTVMSGSMSPTMPTGSIAWVRPVSPTSIGVGDIVAFQSPTNSRALISHRIVAVDTKAKPPTFRTQGDANRAPDLRPVPMSSVRGLVWLHVPYLGYVRAWLESRTVLLVLGAAALILFALGSVRDVVQRRHPASSQEAQ